jgi:hypothetical protein
VEEERDDVAKHGDKGAVNGTDNKASSADEEEVKFDELLAFTDDAAVDMR